MDVNSNYSRESNHRESSRNKSSEQVLPSNLEFERYILQRERELVQREQRLIERECQLLQSMRVSDRPKKQNFIIRDICDVLPEFQPSRNSAKQFVNRVSRLKDAYR